MTLRPVCGAVAEADPLDESLGTFLDRLAGDRPSEQPIGLLSSISSCSECQESETGMFPLVDALQQDLKVSSGSLLTDARLFGRPRHRTEVLPPQLRPGGQIGEYLLVRELGRGGMGVVFQARGSGGKDVALKVVLSPHERRHLARFRREGEITASLNHPGIVRIHGAGEHMGLPYLVYELVEGAHTLDEAFVGKSLLDRVALIRDAARALAHAHDRGVVHRDVKPENILVDGLGHVRLADFGLAEAKGLDRLTRNGTFVGTAPFASPEQLLGRKEDFGPHSDVWALGVVIYLACTGRLPFEGETFRDFVRQVLREDPVSPRTYYEQVPADLERVCFKALSRQIGRRYPSAHELADDLDRVVRGEPVDAPRRRRAMPRGLRMALPLVGFLLTVLVGVWATRRPTVELRFHTPAEGWGAAQLEGTVGGLSGLENLRLVVSGRSVPLRDGTFLAPLDLPDGRHTVDVSLSADGEVLARTQRTVRIDTQAPHIDLRGPAPHAVTTLGKIWMVGSIRDRSPCAVRVGDQPAVAVVPGRSFSIQVPLQAGRNVVRVEAVDAAGNRAPLVTRTVWAPPKWYFALAPGERAPLPLPPGVEFGPQAGEYVHTQDGSKLVWVWLSAPEKLFQRHGDGPPRNFKLYAGPFVAFRRGFFLGKFEVTWGQFKRFVAETGHPLPRPSYSAGDDHPVHGVSWNDAQAYCRWAGLKLPTEAQWEYAARSPNMHVWPWGDVAEGSRANLQGRDRFQHTAPVGSFPQGGSPFGCQDMAGNVFEWVSDFYGPHGKSRQVLVDPTGPRRGLKRVLKGGSYAQPIRLAKSGYRARLAPDIGTPVTGFRVMLPATAPASP